MSLKTKIFLAILIILTGVVIGQYFYNQNLKEDLHNSAMEISVLEQNQHALNDSITFKSDSVAVLHSFISEQDELNKSLDKLYNDIKNTSNQNVKSLRNQIGLLEGEITFKEKVIDSLLVNTDDVVVSDSTITVAVLYNDEEIGLKLDGYTVGNYIDKSGYVFWNEIKTTLPKMRIGLVYEPTDSTIVAMIEANKQITSFKTVMSEDLYKLIINNTTPKKTWMDYICVISEIEFSGEPYFNLMAFGEFRDFYMLYGKRFDVYDKFSNKDIYRFGYKISLKKLTGMIR